MRHRSFTSRKKYNNYEPPAMEKVKNTLSSIAIVVVFGFFFLSAGGFLR